MNPDQKFDKNIEQFPSNMRIDKERHKDAVENILL